MNKGYKVVDKIKRKGYPTSDKNYREAHNLATQAEKKKFPRKQYNELKKLDYDIPSNELLGSHTKSGKVTISKRVPPKDRAEVAFHERYEQKEQKRLAKKK